MRSFVTGSLLGAFLLAGAASAQQTAYTWTGMGAGVVGSSKCATYRMNIDVTVEGNKVKGSFQQDNRPARSFEAVADADGMYKGKATLDDGALDVAGSIKDANPTIVLDGYCKFGGKLTKK
jgi:hypothetical protein